MFIEGPEGSGKTPLANRISRDFGYAKFDWYRVPVDVSGPEVWLGGFFAIACLDGSGAKIVVERSLLSWSFYNNDFSFVERWVELVRNWDSVAIVCLHTSDANLRENIKKKNDPKGWESSFVSIDKYSELYNMLPGDIVVPCSVIDYDVDWVSGIIKQLMEKGVLEY